MKSYNDGYLEHYGVKGMRWGVIRGEERSKQRALIREGKKSIKIDAFNTKASEIQREINDLKKRGDSDYTKSIAYLEKRRDRYKNDAKAVEEGRLTTNQKRAVIGAAAVGTALAAYGTYVAIDSGNVQRIATKLQGNKGAEGFDLLKKRSSLSDSSLSPDDVYAKVVTHINPGYGNPGTTNNCRRATFAYELRRRGYDVKATKTLEGTGQTVFGIRNALDSDSKYIASDARISLIQSIRKNGPEGNASIIQKGLGERRLKVDTATNGENTAQRFFDMINNEIPIGGRGEMGITWSAGGAHSIAWERFKDGVQFFDTQTGLRYRDSEALAELTSRASEIGYTRLDDRDLNMDYLLRWVKNT